MQVEIKIDASYVETKILVLTNEITDEINDLVKSISDYTPVVIVGYRGDEIAILDYKDIINIYSSSGKIIARTNSGEYLLKFRLYELEEKLDKREFVRISNSEIINLRKVKKFDTSYAGTICVEMLDKSTSFVSRRYIPKIKKALGL